MIELPANSELYKYRVSMKNGYKCGYKTDIKDYNLYKYMYIAKYNNYSITNWN